MTLYTIEIGPQRLQGELIKATMPTPTQGRLLHLQQASIAFTEGPLKNQVLVFTLTTPGPASTEEQTQWQSLLDSYTPRQAADHV